MGQPLLIKTYCQESYEIDQKTGKGNNQSI